MKPSVFPCVTALLATTVGYAGPAETAVVAAMKLPDATGYSWVTHVDDDARSYDIFGKTDKSDFSLVTMPMVSTVRRRAGRGASNSENQIDAVFKGDEHCVIQTPDGWKTPAELSAASRSSNSGRRPGGTMGGFGGRGGMGGPGGMGRRGRRGGSGGGDPGDGEAGTPPAYSNLQLGLSRPHEEIGIIVGSYTDIKSDGDAVSGTLSETGAKLLLVHPGQNQLTPLRASGTFRLWVANGELVRYEVKLEGTIAVETSSGRREVEVHQSSRTEVKAIGTTKVEVPDEVRRKLGG